MSRRRSDLVAASMLSLACVGLATLIYHQISEPAQSAAPDVANPGAMTEIPVLPSEPVLSVPPIESFVAVVERPIFLPSRRPAVDPAAPSDLVALEPSFVLRGVVISRSKRFALVQPENGAEPLRVGQGAIVTGWKIIEILKDRVLVRRGDVEHTLELKFDLAPPQGAAQVQGTIQAKGQERGGQEENLDPDGNVAEVQDEPAEQ